MRCTMELLQISMVRGHMAVLDGVQAKMLSNGHLTSQVGVI